MIDLDEQLRDYIDGIASPVPSPSSAEVPVAQTTVVRHRRRRHLAVALLAAAAAVVVVAALIVRLGDSSSNPTSPSVVPAGKPARAIPLTVQGTADCSTVLQPGDAVSFAAVVNGGHSICVTTRDDTYTTFFDGRTVSSGGSVPAGQGGEWFGTVGTDGDRTIVFGASTPIDSSRPPTVWRFAFCDGHTVETRPLNGQSPYYFGIDYDTSLGEPQRVPLVHGKASAEVMTGSCPPPSTVAAHGPRQARKSTALTPLAPGDCSAVMRPGDTVLLGVSVEGGHTICLTRNGNDVTGYLDGQRQGSSTFDSTPGGLSTIRQNFVLDHHHQIYVTNLPDWADGQRLTFCDGSKLTLRPLNLTRPFFVGAILDESKGMPSTLALDGDQPTVGANTNTCPPPTTPTHTSSRRSAPTRRR